MAASRRRKRIHLLDELRGLAVFCMVFYHAFYSMSIAFDMEAGTKLLNFFMPAQPYFAALFIVISGISSRLSHDNTKRGVRLFLVALGLTVLTVVILPQIGFDRAQIYFGILHLLSVSMLVFSLMRKALDKVNPILGVCVCALLYALTYNVSNGILGFPGKFGIELPAALYQTNYFMPFGFYSASFYSADYFPLLPHLFMFLTGTFFGVYAKAGAFPKFSYKQRSKFLSFLGRNALIIYIAHQPVIFDIFYVVELIMKAI